MPSERMKSTLQRCGPVPGFLCYFHSAMGLCWGTGWIAFRGSSCSGIHDWDSVYQPRRGWCVRRFGLGWGSTIASTVVHVEMQWLLFQTSLWSSALERGCAASQQTVYGLGPAHVPCTKTDYWDFACMRMGMGRGQLHPHWVYCKNPDIY